MPDSSFDPRAIKRLRGSRAKRQNDAQGISAGLRSLYKSVVEEPIPDDLMNLLNSLDDEPPRG